MSDISLNMEKRLRAIADEIMVIKLRAFREGDIMTERNATVAHRSLNTSIQFFMDQSDREEEPDLTITPDRP